MTSTKNESIITLLRQASPAERPDIIERLYEKNRKFFKKKFPGIHSFLETASCPYRFDLTERFVNIIHTPSGELAHPEAGLDVFAEMMGGRAHNAWVELLNFKVVTAARSTVHFQTVNRMFSKLKTAFPDCEELCTPGRTTLKEPADGSRFSPPVIFLGIFHGLHIAHYLANTNLNSILLLEPDPERFEVSCYFLDYEALENRFGKLMIHCGRNVNSQKLQVFFNNLAITRQLWTRVLPGYSFKKAPFFIEAMKMMQTTLNNLVYPFDKEFEGLECGAAHLKRNKPILSKKPRLSKKSRIALVASGPSLINDIEWLKKNREGLIIFAVHSAVRPLRKHGIKPNLQFNLDLDATDDFLDDLQLYKDVPLVSLYKVSNCWKRVVDKMLFCSELLKTNPVDFACNLQHTHPSTTDLMFSFTSFCAPKTIYLLGCDFGYRSLGQDHVVGSIFEEKRAKGESTGSLFEVIDQAMVQTNFSEQPSVQSNPFLTRTKVSIEIAISRGWCSATVFNLADGALVKGTRPKRSESIRVSVYKKKKSDLHAIRSSFRPAKKYSNWKPYKRSGKQQLDDFKKMICENIQLEKFSWQGVSAMIDTVVYDALMTCRQGRSDTRMEIYARVLTDMLSAWYRHMIFCDTSEEAAEVYRQGIEFIREGVEGLYWPDSVDDVE